jgi:hypothetical protein
MDVGWQVLQASPKALELAPWLVRVFRGPPNRAVAAVLMQLDKLLAFGLHMRRYNQRGMDTDRAWPIR